VLIAQGVREFDAIHLWQANVEYRDIRIDLAASAKPVGAIVRNAHRMPVEL
jgi:hypothetical protein